MLFLIAILAGIFSFTLFLPGIILMLGGMAGIRSDKPLFNMLVAAVGFGLVVLSMV